MTIAFTARAVRDLYDIGAYIRPRSARGAAAVEASIARTLSIIESFPMSGRTVEQRPSVRVVPAGRFPYLIFYTIVDPRILVLHIRHAARSPVDADEL